MSNERATYIPVEGLGITEEMDQEVRARASQTGKDKWKHFTPEFVGVQVQTVDLKALDEQMGIARRNYEQGRLSQNEGVITFKQDAPVTVAFMGDMHWGSIYCNYEEVERKLKEIKDTPNMYVMFMANLIDNAIPSQFPSNMLANSIPPDKQVIYAQKHIQDLDKAGKVLGAVTSPCHEGWTYKHTGQDVNALIYGFKGRNFPVVENGGLITLKFPNVDYRVNLFHQVGPYESNFNETHALKQLNRLQLQMRADVVAGAHKHVNAVEQVWEGTKEERRIVTYIRTGSEKGTGPLHDQWANDKYGSTGEPSGPTITLSGVIRKMIPNAEFDTGVLCHEALYVSHLVKKQRRAK